MFSPETSIKSNSTFQVNKVNYLQIQVSLLITRGKNLNRQANKTEPVLFIVSKEYIHFQRDTT